MSTTTNWWEQYPEVTATGEVNGHTPERIGERVGTRQAEPQTVMIEEKRSDGGKRTLVLKEDPAQDSLLRQLGLTARAAVQAVAGLPGMAADAVTGPINAVLDKVRGEGNGFRFQRTSAALGNVMDAAGLPQPANATERVVQDVASGVGGAGVGVAAGKALASGGGAVAQRVGTELARGPGVQAASAAGMTGAMGITRENGGSEGQQLAAGVAGALAPIVAPAAAGAAARGVLRGGEVGRTAMAARLADAATTGVPLTLGQATDNAVVKGAESVLARTPGASGVLREFADLQTQRMETAVRDAADMLSPGADAVKAGQAIKRGVEGFKDGIKGMQTRLYATLDKFIPADSAVDVSSTRAALAALNEGIPNAEALSRFFRNAKINDIEGALVEDLTKAGSGALPFEAIKKLRTMVGGELAEANFLSDIPRSKWKTLYEAISDDLGRAAKTAGPEAESAWQWANSFSRSQIERLEQLRSIVERDTPERIFEAAVSGGDRGYTTARRVISALPQAERKEVAAALLMRLGRATNAEQNAAGDAFSSEAFLANFAAMTPGTRRALFGSTDAAEVMPQVEALARQAQARMGSGRTMGSGNAATVTANQVGLAGGAGAVAAGLSGAPEVLGAAAAGAVGANLAAKGATSRGIQDFIAKPTTLAEGTAPAAVRAAGMEPPKQLEGDEWWMDQPQVNPPPVSAPIPSAAPTSGPVPAAPLQSSADGMTAAPLPTLPQFVEPVQQAQAQPTAEERRQQAAQGFREAATVGEAIEAAMMAVSVPIEPQPAQRPHLNPTVAMSRRPAMVMGTTFETQEQAQEAARFAGMADAEISADGGGFVVLPRLMTVSAPAAPAGDGGQTVLWTGRRGDGYETPEAAGNALAQRRLARPDLEWSIQRNADQRFILVGTPDPQYEQRQQLARLEAERAKLRQMAVSYAA